MDILLVGDAGKAAAASAELFRRIGHAVSLVGTSAEALEHYRRHRPDLLVTGVDVSGSDGVALVQAVLRHAAPRWQPAICLVSAWDEDLNTRAVEAGADACFVMPRQAAALQARLDVIARLLKMQQDAEARLARIDRYLATEAEDLRIARHLVEYQMAPEDPRLLDDPAVQHWRQSSASQGGDMLSVARAPSGVLHVMLADACSSGLSAYISLLPIIAPFYRMTEKGFPLATIARELNLKVRQALPANRPVAAQLVAVDTREGIVSIWNGGMPAALMLDGFAQHFRAFAQQHPALGVLADEAFDERVEQHALTRGEQLVMVSDGLLAATGPDGRCFGEQGVADALVGLPRGQRRAEVTAALAAHLDGQTAADDMSLVLIDCEKEAASPAMPLHKPVRQHGSGSWRFSLRLSASELAHLDVVPLLLNVAEQLNATRERGGELFLILSELYNNALDHGVLRLDSELKLSPDGMETWLRMREERLAALSAGEIELSVEQVSDAGQAWLRIGCRDSGPGFDVSAFTLRAKPRHAVMMPSTLPFGRGLALVQHLAQGINFNETGNEITALLRLDDHAEPPEVRQNRAGVEF
jgi:serine phosphatase RsbU (regulator of sigma subunit)/anti-sigma regulatory factor (Ser/Thr protein kinase)